MSNLLRSLTEYCLDCGAKRPVYPSGVKGEWVGMSTHPPECPHDEVEMDLAEEDTL